MKVKFRKRPIVIEAEQFSDAKSGQSTLEWIRSFPEGVCFKGCSGSKRPHVHTIHQGQVVDLVDRDWVVPEPDGQHYYPVKNEVIESTYERIE